MTEFTQFLQWFVPAVIVPLFVFLVNLVWRNKKSYPLTAAADFILAIIIYDFTVITASDVITPLVKNPYLRASVIPDHFVFVFFAFLCWYLVTTQVEPTLETFYRSGRSAAAAFPTGRFWLAWIGTGCLLGLHVFFFMTT